jgi:hypothetical protein
MQRPGCSSVMLGVSRQLCLLAIALFLFDAFYSHHTRIRVIEAHTSFDDSPSNSSNETTSSMIVVWVVFVSVFLTTTWLLFQKPVMALRGLLVGLLRRSEIRSPSSVEWPRPGDLFSFPLVLAETVTVVLVALPTTSMTCTPSSFATLLGTKLAANWSPKDCFRWTASGDSSANLVMSVHRKEPENKDVSRISSPSSFVRLLSVLSSQSRLSIDRSIIAEGDKEIILELKELIVML